MPAKKPPGEHVLTLRVYLYKHQIETAKALGDGNFSEGVRRAIAIANGLGSKVSKSIQQENN